MKFLLTILVVVLSTFTFSQCESVMFKGKVYDTLRPQSFYNMMIVNRKTGKGVFGQPNGHFSVYVNNGDSITISIKGYDLINIVVRADENCRFVKEFPIIGKPHEFEEVIVRPIKTLEQIKEEREALVMIETRTVTGMEVIQSPITALYQAFSRTERNKRKVEEWKFQDNKRSIIKELLRTYVAYDVVNLTEDEFDDFINFLNMDPNFLRTATEWELIEFIKGKYEHFMYLRYHQND
ncbi:MAG: hypothetical protein M9916_05835 [Crocinitomicaceae bacterium]|nr:hypothetical protein [Crocinitomicaceae bacterium]